MKYLYVNGCSYSWGGEFNSDSKFMEQLNTENDGYSMEQIESDKQAWHMTKCNPSGEEFESVRLKNTWPFHLGKLLGLTTINESLGCGSNQRTMRMTLDYIKKQKNIKDTMFIIQLTSPTRTEFYSPTYEDYVLGKVDSWSYGDKDNLESKTLKMYYENFVDIETEHKKMIDLIYSMDCIFKTLGVEYYFVFGQHTFKEWKDEVEKFKSNLINWDNFIWKGNHSITRCIGKTDYTHYPADHLTPKGHEIVAKKIYGDIR